jgi:TRAP-type C4-dicarboxylate transport system substrate-binding protein
MSRWAIAFHGAGGKYTIWSGAHPGRINIKLYPGVSLIQGDQTREFSAIRQGDRHGHRLDQQLVPTGQGTESVFHALSDADYAAADALTQGEVGKDIFKSWKIRCGALAWGENGYREISNPSWRSKRQQT